MLARLALRAMPGLAVIAFVICGVTLAPSLGPSVVREDGPVESLQVALALVGAAFIVRSAARCFSPADVFLGLFLAGLAASEIDLDRRIFGLSVVDWKFFRRPLVPPPLKVVVAAVFAAILLALLTYAALRWRTLLAEAKAGLAHGWGVLFLAGAILFAIPQPSERGFNRLFPLPRDVAEEAMELAGCVYFAWAMVARDRQRATYRGLSRRV